MQGMLDETDPLSGGEILRASLWPRVFSRHTEISDYLTVKFGLSRDHGTLRESFFFVFIILSVQLVH